MHGLRSLCKGVSREGNVYRIIRKIMKIRVYTPSFCDTAMIDDKGKMDLPDGSTLRDVYKLL